MTMRIFLLAFLFLPLTVAAKPYLDIRELHTPKGLTVWYVQDKTVPALALKFSLRGGTQLDPAGKEGVGNLLTTLFDEGAGKRDAEQFQDDLDSYGIHMGFNIGPDRFSGGLKTTTKNQVLAIELFDDALNRPHFTPEAIERMRQAILSEQRMERMNPGWLASKTLMETLFPNHPYSRLTDGTPETVQSITVDDLKKQKDTLFCRDNLKIAVSGDIDPKSLSATIDRLFGAWPRCAYTVSDEIATLQNPGKTVQVNWDGAQSIVIMAQPGLKRQDKDWWTARILDFALGGGEFSSRLLDEVRVKRGLTYGISTSIAPYDRGPLWLIQAGIDPAKTDEAIAVTKKIWDDVAKNGLHDDEIKEAQDYLIGVLPLALTSTDQIAAILMQLQEDGLPKDTLDKRAEEIHAVTADDIKRVAKSRLNADALTTILVGPKREQKHEPSHPVKTMDQPVATGRDLR